MATDNKGRPNIRVQILNNLTESMEVDEKSENEEGEISDDEMLKTAPNKISIDPPATNRVNNLILSLDQRITVHISG